MADEAFPIGRGDGELGFDKDGTWYAWEGSTSESSGDSWTFEAPLY